MPADQDVEDDAVDAVVLAVVGDGADGGGVLAEPVDAAFALFVAGGVPGEVVVDDGGEALLQVDAFGQAVGGDQQRGGRRGRVRVSTRDSRSSGGRVAGDGARSAGR